MSSLDALLDDLAERIAKTQARQHERARFRAQRLARGIVTRHDDHLEKPLRDFILGERRADARRCFNAAIAEALR